MQVKRWNHQSDKSTALTWAASHNFGVVISILGASIHIVCWLVPHAQLTGVGAGKGDHASLLQPVHGRRVKLCYHPLSADQSWAVWHSWKGSRIRCQPFWLPSGWRNDVRGNVLPKCIQGITSSLKFDFSCILRWSRFFKMHVSGSLKWAVGPFWNRF